MTTQLAPFTVVPPVAPYAIVNPLDNNWNPTLIKAGDIKTNHNGVWCPVEAYEVGRIIPVGDVKYARVQPLNDLYKVVEDEDLHVIERDLYWNADKWHEVQQEWVGKPVKDIPGNPHVCTLVDPDDARVIDEPEDCRKLWPGETIRKNDRTIRLGKTEWEDIDNSLLKTTVPMPNEENKYVRYCRPIKPNFRVWYVQEGAKRGGDGSLDKPYVSLETAKTSVLQSARAMQTTVHGIICSTVGVPLLAFDTQQEDDACRLDGALPGSIADIAAHLGIPDEAVLEDARHSLPLGAKLMQTFYCARKDDLWYGPVSNDYTTCQWQEMPIQLVGMKRVDTGFIFGRVNKEKLAGLANKVRILESTMQAMMRLIVEIKSDMNM